MKKKILFVITKSNFGGAQKYVFDLATNLPHEQFDVAVALGGSGLLVQKLHEKNIRVIPIFSLTRDVSAGSDLSAFLELWSIFRKEKPDVVHLNSAKAGGVGALAGRLAGVPKIIFTAHGWAFNEERPFWQQIIIKFFSWFTVMLSHKTIAVSDAVKNNARNWPFVAQKIVVIKNGIREPDFLARETARQRLFVKTNRSIPENAFIVGTIAELHKNKGLQYAIEAFAELVPKNPNLYYFILGGGEENEILDTLVGLHGLQERVFLFGFTDDAARFLTAFDMFVLPSITEGLALVLLEAGLAKLPVVASRVGGIPEIIEDGKTGFLVPPRNPAAIVDAITKLQANHLIAKSFGAVLRERVLSEFSISRVLKSTIPLYMGN